MGTIVFDGEFYGVRPAAVMDLNLERVQSCLLGGKESMDPTGEKVNTINIENIDGWKFVSSLHPLGIFAHGCHVHFGATLKARIQHNF
ncbi:MAG TPA: hypothetical protein VKV04_11215 [Verrucomicrobiae bacterium]|nr:hypothetical protein [Verrucomicrobiae bacterium]